MIQRLLLSIPFAFAWMLITANLALDSFLVGWLVSFLILLLVFPNLPPRTLKHLRLLDRTLAGVIYVLTLFRDIYLSATDVARRIVDPKLPMNPGILAIPVAFEQDGDQKTLADLIAAVSAHGITITPGELVVDFDGNSVMYVHCLDVEASATSGPANQAKRLALLKRILS